MSAEEEELLGSSGGPPPEEPPKEGNPAEINVERDEKLIKVPILTIWSMCPGACVRACLPTYLSLLKARDLNPPERVLSGLEGKEGGCSCL